MRQLLLTIPLMFPLSAMADDMALVLGNERYEQLPRVSRADDVLDATDRFEALGFTVLSRANGRHEAAQDLAQAFQENASEADRLVVTLSGHFVTDGDRTWFLTSEATSPDLFTVDDFGLSVESLLHVLAQRPGQAVLVLGVSGASRIADRGGALRDGLGGLDIPQGVTVVRASPSDVNNFVSGALTTPEANLGPRLRSERGLTIEGYLPESWVLMPGEVLVETPPDTPTGPTEDELNAEAAMWDRATAADSVPAYRQYVARYPQGRFIDEAEAQIEAILSEPNRAARLAEEALNLTRSQRRDIQSDLTLLNYNTRGVDGIFGSGSRGAITNWQQSNGFPQTSYVTQEQISLLDAQAARRQAEIEAEEARARAQAEALDRSYWAETGGRGDEPGYRAYLERYPEGLFANIATARLGEIEDRRRIEAEAADREAWVQAREEDTAASYQDYLAAFPSGVFETQARARLEALTAPRLSDEQIAQARAEEAALRLSGVRAQLLELRLRDLGHNPGRLDGVIDQTTRDAIADYQETNGLLPTGYVDRSTAVGLLTGSINVTIPRQ